MRAALLVPRLQIALAVIAALRAPRRAIAAGLGLVARARLLAAGALHQHAAALAIGDQAAFSSRLERLFAARCATLFILSCWVGLARHRPVEIRAGEGRNLLAELLAQHAGLDLLDLAFGQLAQLKRPVGHPDQPVHLEAEMRQHVAYLAVLALTDRKYQPDIGALVALQRRIDRTVFDAVDLDAVFQFIKLGLRHLAMGTDPIAPQPAGIRQFERARQAAIIGQEKQAFGVEIEPADADQPRQPLRKIVEYRRPSFGVGMGSHQAARLVEQEQARALARRQRLAVDGDDVVGGDIERRRIDDAAVDRDAALHDPLLGIAARGQPRPRHHLGDALAGFLFARRPRWPALVRRALAIGAAAAERRAFCKDLAVVFVVTAWTIRVAAERSRLAARMLLPSVAALARTLELRTILAGTIELRPLTKRPITLGAILARAGKSRTLIAAAIFPGLVVTRLVKFRLIETSLFELSCAIRSGARIATDVIGRGGVALLPRLFLTAIRPKILARTTVRRAARKFLVAKFPAAKFLVGEARCRAGFVAVAPRAVGKRSILAGTIVTVEAQGARRIVAFTARPFAFARVGFARARIGLVAE